MATLKEKAHYNINWLEDSENENLRKIGDTFDQYIYQLESSIAKDNYHTMDELYEHRTILFAIVCKLNRDKAWKSRRHSDGTSEDGWFIAGIETPYGQLTYHQKMQYWNLFDVNELPKALPYDGHTSEQVLERLKLTFLGEVYYNE